MTADSFVSAEAPRSTAYLLANQLFADAPHRAEVTVKRRRLVLQGSAASEPLDSPAKPGLAVLPDDGHRAPRVFVVARDEAAAAMPTEAVSERPAQPGRRRVEPVRRPGKVVLIVPPQAETEPPDESIETLSADPFAPDLGLWLKRVDEHRAVRAALERVRALTADAVAASKFRF